MAAYERPDNSESDWADLNRRREATAARVDRDEARWLAEKFGHGGPLHDNERAVLAFIKQHARHVHPDLQPLLDQVA